MAVKALSRPKSTNVRSTNRDIRHEHVNLDPLSHPQGRAREYARAVTAAKLDWMFAMPFVGEMRGGHSDSITSLSISRTSLCPIVTGCVDGSMRIWDLQGRRCVGMLNGAHSCGGSGVVFGNGVDGRIYSCGEDGVVRSWNVFPLIITHDDNNDDGGYGRKPRARKIYRNSDDGRGGGTHGTSTRTDATVMDGPSPHGPMSVYRLPSSRGGHNGSGNNNNVAFHSIDHHWSKPRFVTSSLDASVRVWDPERSVPIINFDDLWGGDDTVTVVRYNPSERDLIAHCSGDRGVKALSRPKLTNVRSTNRDIRHEHVNLDPLSHPQGRAREYARAVTAAKLDWMFAMPFVGEMRGGHSNSITSLSISRTSLCPIVTGCVDGSMRIWDLQGRRCVGMLNGAHSCGGSGVVFGNGVDGRIYSCGEDGVVRSWNVFPLIITHDDNNDDGGYGRKPRARKIYRNSDDGRGGGTHGTSTRTDATVTDGPSPHGPMSVYRLPSSRGGHNGSGNNNNVAFHSIDHHWSEPRFVTSSLDASVRVWDPERSVPIINFDDLWGGDDTVTVVRYNPSERDLIAHCSGDRGVGLHDGRTSSPLRKTIMSMRANCL
ncbi:hypothetical protein ACHAXA_005789, partial [Cyclostephanos tholiformis]